MKRKEMLKRGLLFLLAAAILLFATLAWFTNNKVVDVQPLTFYSAETSKVNAQLFLKTGEDEAGLEIYEPVARIECKNYLPGQTQRYKILFTNTEEASCHVRVDLLNFHAERGEDMLLCDVLRLETQADKVEPPLEEGETFSQNDTFTNIFSQAGDVENRSIILAHSILVGGRQGDANGTRSLVFDISLPGDTENAYQNRNVKLESIAIQVSQ